MFDHIGSYLDIFFFLLEDFYVERKCFLILLLPIDEEHSQNRNFTKFWGFEHLIDIKLECITNWLLNESDSHSGQVSESFKHQREK